MNDATHQEIDRYVTRTWQEVSEGDKLPSVTLPVTLSLCVLDAAATHDFFPGHHDRDYAQAQNVRNVYLNTMFFHGFVDRIAGQWLGPRAWLVRRRLDMAAPVCVGDTIHTEAEVRRRYQEDGRALVEIEVRVMTEHALGVRAVLTYAVPRSAGESVIAQRQGEREKDA